MGSSPLPAGWATDDVGNLIFLTIHFYCTLQKQFSESIYSEQMGGIKINLFRGLNLLG